MASESHRYTAKLGGDDIIIETGKLAEQAGGAITIQHEDTVLFAVATMSKQTRDLPFFPLSVDYEEKMYAAGRIPGSFFRREGRPSEGAILIARVTDRSIRPLFPKMMRNEVQIVLNAFSHDQEHFLDILGITAASAALSVSDIPWNGPVAGVRIGYINNELVVSPSISQMEESTLDLRVAGTKDAINMVECGANEIDEGLMVEALELAHESMQGLISVQEQMRAEVGKAKNEYQTFEHDDDLNAEVMGKVRGRVYEIIKRTPDRDERKVAIDEVEAELHAEYEQQNAGKPEDEQVKMSLVIDAVEAVVKDVVRSQIVEDGVRPDGRGYEDIRDLSADVGVIPRVHGTGLFKRGQTQVLTIATLGTPRDSQSLDGLYPEDSKRYLHHYNFPPYSVGETGRIGSPKRREIGHGALAETALIPMLPDEKAFPYTIRLVSEVMSSNGSTSMASVCGSTLALMDAGVPITRPVAGIAMGLIKEGDKVAVLTDIQGLEDHLGDMDFKVAGTDQGITALQMDIKIAGVTGDVLRQALQQARDARMKILGVITDAIDTPRDTLSDYAPRMISIQIDSEKIGAVIGPGGKTIRSIQDRCDVKIDIENDGEVFIAGADASTVDRAVEEIRALTEDAEIGRIYTGTVKRIESYGVFVEFLPGKDGMVHISQLSDHHVASTEDEVSIGDEIMVMVTDVNDGKVRLSRQAVLEGWTAEEARDRDRKPSSKGRGGSGGGGGGNRGGSGRGRGTRY